MYPYTFDKSHGRAIAVTMGVATHLRLAQTLKGFSSLCRSILFIDAAGALGNHGYMQNRWVGAASWRYMCVHFCMPSRRQRWESIHLDSIMAHDSWDMCAC